MSKILIIGGSGLIGSHIAEYFKNKNHFIGIIAHSRKDVACDEFIEANTTIDGEWQEKIKQYEIVINLTGANIGRRWTKKYKQIIENSQPRNK